MASILFFEKPGCQNNTRQKAWLELSGHTVDAVNILEYAWTKEELSLYLGENPISACFNPAAPEVKTGSMKPELLNKEDALDAMIKKPLLIRRPLLKIGNHYLQGFDTAVLRTIISLEAVPGAEKVIKSFITSDFNNCPHSDTLSCNQF
ncbi:thioredoxin domain-containing protein [Chlorobium phaeobacteroides]|jgi:nitrogenase-associated protein|uniref:Nitrogenase-associated protein n=1 Tax=Chlorobium phaeobacteroides (strain DSM 266 / SMG 266 / 2430) TaxID=290317 RepID=A1BEY2_CHLPD|nr:ArsC/Spx/MgsR family protein [Chlorobium phaeobacteroides]ABL64959.1 nitrogenase-associated protein [Chlorobium phaeobacteroides DSM 266]MBV5329292.1 arsenate reductase family protein [Chlorobium sp.]